MKRNILFIAIISTILASCSGEKKSDLASKKEELAKLKTEQGETDKKIKALEIDIAKLDPKKAGEARVKAVTVAPLNAETFRHYVELQGTVDA